MSDIRSRKGSQEGYLEEIQRWMARVKRLVEEKNALRAENERLREALQWIAQQTCGMDAEGASKNTTCAETSACISEWCLPCYADKILNPDREVSDE